METEAVNKLDPNLQYINWLSEYGYTVTRYQVTEIVLSLAIELLLNYLVLCSVVDNNIISIKYHSNCVSFCVIKNIVRNIWTYHLRLNKRKVRDQFAPRRGSNYFISKSTLQCVLPQVFYSKKFISCKCHMAGVILVFFNVFNLCCC